MDDMRPLDVAPEAVLLTRHLKHLVRAIAHFPDIRWVDAVSDGQLHSKQWLAAHLDGLNRDLGTVLVTGGWVGFLPLILLSRMPGKCDRIVTLDRDETAGRAADLLLRHHVMDGLRAFAACGDAMALRFDPVSDFERIKEDGTRQRVQQRCDTIINTSWEHFADPAAWFSRIPKGRLVCIQASTVPDLNDHKSCPADLTALCDMTPMTHRFCAETLPHGAGHRLMTIGVV